MGGIGLGLGLGTLHTPGGAPVVFDPATLNFNGLWLADYTAPGADPRWIGTASIGTSGAHNLNVGGDGLPSTTTAQGGKVPALLNGGDLISIVTLPSLVTAAAGTVGMLAWVNAAAAAGGGPLNDPALMSDDGGGTLCISYSTTGFRGELYDGISQKNCGGLLAAPFGGDPRGAYHWVWMRWDGTFLTLRVDRADGTPVACGNASIAFGNPKFLLGKQPGVSFANARVLAVCTAPITMSTANMNHMVDFGNSTYSLSL